VSLLEERERIRLAALTECSADDIERILLAAAAEHLIVLLPAFHTVEDFRGWEAFKYDGGSKSAHLAERDAMRALCGAGRPWSAVVDVAARVRVCVGCVARVEHLAEHPSALGRYDRGAPLPGWSPPAPTAARLPKPAEASPAVPVATAVPARPAARAARARASTPPPVEPARPAPAVAAPSAPQIEEPAAPSLFDVPIATPRARPKRPL